MPSPITRRVSKATGRVSWTVQVRIGTKSDGKPRWLTKTFEKQRDAKAYLAKVIKDRDSGLVVQPSKMLLNEFLDKWLESAVEPRVRANTYRSYQWQLKKYVRGDLGGYRLCDISPLQIQKLYSKLHREGLSSRVVRYTHSILNNAFGQAVKWRMLASNPCSGAELPRAKQKEAQVLNVEEVTEFVRVLRGNRHEVLFLVALTTGMRPSEYLALQWNDIEFDSSRIQVLRSLDWRRKGQWEFSGPKTARSRRSIPIPAEVLNRLQEHRRFQAEERLKVGPSWNDHSLVFCDRKGEPLDRQNLLRRHLRPLLKKAETSPDLTLYGLRHSCATLMLAAGIHPKVVSERLGHSSITITLDVYSHVLPNLQVEASETLAEVMFEERQR
jgi:integrase